MLFKALNLTSKTGKNSVSALSKATGIPSSTLNYYDDGVFPSGNDLKSILEFAELTETQLRLRTGHLNTALLNAIAQSSAEVLSEIEKNLAPFSLIKFKTPKLELKTKYGKLYRSDCLDFLHTVKSDSVDLVFADPPFNLDKEYPSKINDNLDTDAYLLWCEQWINECIRVLKPGGSLFIWNLPKWNSRLSEQLNSSLSFRNWIGVDIKYRLPIKSKLYPSHYSLLYYVKGEKPNIFHPDRLPMEVCSKCHSELHDYGGYKNKMNPNGINLSDIWYDIPPVRHSKYKRRQGSNELSLKLMDRIIEMSSNPGDLVLDPFGGSGTTYMAAELKKRKWIGCEIGPSKVIKDRFKQIEDERKILLNYRSKLNKLFPKDTEAQRIKKGLWTTKSFKY